MTTLDVTPSGSAEVPENRAQQVRIIRTGPRGLAHPTSDFAGLLSAIRDAGLLRRRRTFYILLFLGLTAILVGCWVAFAYLRGSWYELIIAGVLGVLFTQYAFLAHESSHRQVWDSPAANENSARVIGDLIVGISLSWWMNKHTRHHAKPNTIGLDPDIDKDFLVFHEQQARELKGIAAWVAPRQGWIFFPALMLEGLNLYVQAFRTVLSPGRVDKRGVEIVLLTVRTVAYFAAIFYFLPLGMAFAFVGVQMAVFGVYMGASFAPNHKGMPQLAADAKVDFLRRQVLTSRNVEGLGMTTAMGGLNYQIEHHLFPTMPRPHLKRASVIVREYCAAQDVSYASVPLLVSYGIVIRYFNRVGLAARDPFDCPAAADFGR